MKVKLHVKMKMFTRSFSCNKRTILSRSLACVVVVVDAYGISQLAHLSSFWKNKIKINKSYFNPFSLNYCLGGHLFGLARVLAPMNTGCLIRSSFKSSSNGVRLQKRHVWFRSFSFFVCFCFLFWFFFLNKKRIDHYF